MNVSAVLLWNLVALLHLAIGADLAGDRPALLPGCGGALLLGDLVAHWGADWLWSGLRNVLAGFVRVRFAGARDWDPDLGSTLSLPLVLTVILVLCLAVGLCDCFIFSFGVLSANIPVHSCTGLSLYRSAFLFGNIVALWPGDCVA